jgi:hypothetical protein
MELGSGEDDIHRRVDRRSVFDPSPFGADDWLCAAGRSMLMLLNTPDNRSLS